MEPAWFGVPLGGPADLGDAVAADPRFTSCAVEVMAGAFWGREPDLKDFGELRDLEQAFVQEGLILKALIRAILATDDYRVGALESDASEEVAERLMTRRVMTVNQLADAVEDLTGFRWEDQGFDLLEDDTIGYRVMGGGVDGHTVTRPDRTPTMTRAIVTRRLAQAAAAHVVGNDLVEEDEPKLFTEVDLDDVPGDAEFTAELEYLHLRMHGTPADATEIEEEEALWIEVEAISNAEQAWVSVVALLIRDTAFWTY
jgi:hypothetical protein